MLHFSPLIFSKNKRSGRSFGRITVRHRGSGQSYRMTKSFNFSLFSNPYFFSRFFNFTYYNYSISNIFCFSKNSNQLIFFINPLYTSFTTFSMFTTNIKNKLPSFSLFSSDFFPFILTHETFKEDTELDILGFSPYRTNFLNVTNGAYIHNLSIFSFSIPKKITYSRSFFSYTRFVRKLGSYSYVKLPSSSLIAVNTFSNFNFYGYGERLRENKSFYSNCFKAGFYRTLGFRPSVRGVAMNPVDHPHGGRTGESRPSVSPWAILTKGYPTVRKIKRAIPELLN